MKLHAMSCPAPYDAGPCACDTGAVDDGGAVRKPTHLRAIASERVDVICITDALRDGHWLHHQDDRYFHMTLFVSAGVADEAKKLWPTATVDEPVGVPEPAVEFGTWSVASS